MRFTLKNFGGIAALSVAVIAAAPVCAGNDFNEQRDFGSLRDRQLREFAESAFGVERPLDASSGASIDKATAEANPTALATVARGLKVRVLNSSASLAPVIDMIALWPNDQNPTHLIVCNEEGTAQPGVQRVRMDGLVETILSGTTSCDPVRRTPWGTIIVGEETADGHLIEILNPLSTTNVSYNRGTGLASGGIGSENVVSRDALGRLAFEGIALYPNGVMYYGDENRPSNGNPGGAYFKFVPTNLWTGSGAITNLNDSPLAGGKVYGLRLGRRSGNTDFGQGSNTGQGIWVDIVAAGQNIASLRAATSALKLTGYYRPEDADIDGKALVAGNVRFCANNTGNESNNHNWGEAICITDGTLTEATANTAIPEVQTFVVGTKSLTMMDNIAYHPTKGFWVLHEDADGVAEGRNNDLWACLEDGADDDTLSDGCVRVATLNDLTAEWSGGIFNADGSHFYVSVQHNVTGHGVILDITGWNR
jgi:secreted PhoX family phosphatase